MSEFIRVIARRAAVRLYHEDDAIEIDPDAPVILASSGKAWVTAQVCVAKDELGMEIRLMQQVVPPDHALHKLCAALSHEIDPVS